MNKIFVVVVSCSLSLLAGPMVACAFRLVHAAMPMIAHVVNQVCVLVGV